MTRIRCSKVTLNVSHFKPEELSVKTVDNFLVIEAKHEERPDEHGFVCRQFTRRYLLPPGVKPEEITHQVSPDGVLTITAPRALPAPTPSVEVVAPSPAPQPQPQDVPAQQPEPQPATAQQPEPQPTPAQQPEPQPAPAQQPEPQPAPAQQ